MPRLNITIHGRVRGYEEGEEKFRELLIGRKIIDVRIPTMLERNFIFGVMEHEFQAPVLNRFIIELEGGFLLFGVDDIGDGEMFSDEDNAAMGIFPDILGQGAIMLIEVHKGEKNEIQDN